MQSAGEWGMSDSTLPRYRQIADHLRALVSAGRPGDRLPSDAELCAEFGVSRMTARQAVDVLQAEDLVVRRQGQGTFVADRPVPRLLGSPLSFTESMRRRGSRATSRLLAAGLVAPAPSDAAALRLADDSDVVLVERLRLAEGVPMAIERAALVPDLAGVLDRDLETGSLHLAMEELGRRPTISHAQVRARLADPRERRLLGLAEPGVLLCERRVIEDQDGVPVEHTETRYAAERYVFEAVEHRDGRG
jgi:GntR family transcriptional regulator